MHSCLDHFEGSDDLTLWVSAADMTRSWSSARVAMTVRTRVFMFWIVTMLDIVSVGWQWASYTPKCHGNGSFLLLLFPSLVIVNSRSTQKFCNYHQPLAKDANKGQAVFSISSAMSCGIEDDVVATRMHKRLAATGTKSRVHGSIA
jgi:hypothetical protein